MKAYSSNILPRDASYYTLINAHINAQGLVFDASGGSASIKITSEILGVMTEYFRINVIVAPSSDTYNAEITCTIKAIAHSGKYFTHRCNLSTDDTTFTTEIEMIAEEYDEFTVSFESSVTAVISLWELCPETTDDVEALIDGVRQSLPKLLYDYNTTTIRVEQSEQIVSIINCYLIDSTDLQGHFLMNFTASERCTVHLRFFDSSMIELFSPLVHTVEAGHNTLEVPHAYLIKQSGIHSFYVTAQVTNGYLSVPIRGILFTLDGGYLAERLMNPEMDLSDISLRQLADDQGPSEIWAIGVDNSQVIVKKRNYNLRQPNLAWEAVYTLGEGKYGAIEFDGYWKRCTGEDRYTIVTDMLPMIAYVDMDDVLWVYQRGMDATPIQIASGVTCISLVRGYKAQDFPEQDQGIVLGWVQNGDAYYKQYAYFQGAYQWYPTERLTNTNDITSLQIHRLNDYRLGIITQGASENIWYITDRTYVSQAVPTEIIDTSFDGLNKFIMMTKEEEAALSFAAAPNTFSNIDAAQRDFSITFMYTYLHHIELLKYTLEEWKNVISVTADSKALGVDEYDLRIEGATLHIHLHESVWGIVKVSWNKISFLFFLDNFRYFINTQASYSFTWNVWRSKSHNQFPDRLNVSLAGSVDLQYIEINRPVSRQPETVIADVAGDLVFQYVEVNKVKHPEREMLNTVLEGTAVFTYVLVGSQPI